MSNVVQFSAFAAAAKLAKKDSGNGAIASYLAERAAKRAARLAEVATNPNLTATCKNQRLRLSRRDAWWAARRLTEYWRARMEWDSALSIAQTHDVADANSFPKCDDSPECRLVDLWRTALVSQMLTPAPDMAAVAWKRGQLRKGQHRFVDVKSEKLQRAIDADVKWLEAHPTRIHVS